jgi:hypothetical protein
VETSRGRKGKKAFWHLTLGLKDTIFAGIGVVGLMMISFALGALAGRGDIYRAAYSWGLMSPDQSKVAQYAPPVAASPVSSPGTVPGTVPAGTPVAAGTAPAAAPVAAAPANPAAAPAPVAAAPAKHPGTAPVTGSIAAVSGSAPSATAKKKAKSGSSPRDRKAQEEEMHRLRQEVSKKLKFQNSFDTAPKPPKVAAKQKPKDTKAKATPAPTQVKVAQFRDAKSAKAKVAELEKKGIKATLKQGKDQKGSAVFTVYRQSTAKPQDSDKLAQKPPKSTESKPQPNPR